MTLRGVRPLAATLLIASLATPVRAAGPVRPTAAADGVRWSLALAPASAPDSALALLLAGAAARRVARERLAMQDTTGADSALASDALVSSPWAWDSMRQRADWSLARGDTARADRLLGATGPALWPEAERAAWSVMRARTRLALGDTAEAQSLASVLVLTASSASAARTAVRLLEQIRAARGEPLRASERTAAADLEARSGDRTSAVLRWKGLYEEGAGSRATLALRIAEQLRLQRRFADARAWADSALRRAPDAPFRERAQLERARIARAARTSADAMRAYDRLSRSATDEEVRGTATWELAREAQDAGHYARAESAFVRMAHSGSRRAEEARVLAGLCAYARGARDRARAHWALGTSEPARFWEGVALRDRARRVPGRSADRVRGDSLLASIAARPGYRFHRAAARETLGVRGWHGEVAESACSDSVHCRVLATARTLVAEGDTLDATALLQRWAAADPRAGGGRRARPADWLAAASLAYGVARPDLGTRYVDRALEAAGEDSARVWPLIAWAYPPAFEDLVRAQVVDSLGIDAALLWGLMRQESRFDPRARSSSDALGLAQLLLSTARDVARWERDPAPTAERLFTPAVGVRYGARYLAYLLGRFERRVAVALAAYNAGPGTVRPDWRALIEQGGDALFAEFASNADSQDYARRILGFRQAYRELAPSARP